MDLQQVMRGAVVPRPPGCGAADWFDWGGGLRMMRICAGTLCEGAGFPVAAVVDLNQERQLALLAGKFGDSWKVVATIARRRCGWCRRRVVPDRAGCLHPALIAVLEQLPDGAAALLQKPMRRDSDDGGGGDSGYLPSGKGLTAAINFQVALCARICWRLELWRGRGAGDLYTIWR